MTKQDKDTKKKVTEGKKAAKAANKAAKNNKLRKAADKMLMDAAADMPGNGGSFLLQCARENDVIEKENAKIKLARKALRAKMKTNKVVLEVFDAVMKMRKREPEEVAAYRATEAIYTEQLGMELSPAQKEQIEIISQQKKKARAAMDEVSEGDSGKEIGSGTVTEEEIEAKPVVPAKNKTIALAAGSVAAH